MEQVSGQPGGATLGEYSGALRRRWWVVVLGAVVGLGMAAAFLLVAPRTYASTASVLVNPVGGELDNAVDGARTSSLVNLDTEAVLVTSQAVSSRAKVFLQTTEVVGQLVENVSVEVPANTNVLRISFTGRTAEEARLGASAYAAAYLANRRESADDLLERQERALRQQIAGLESQLPGATSAELPQLKTSLETVNTRLAYLVGTEVNPGKVISESLLPEGPASPNAGLILTGGLVCGLLLGLIGIYVLERRDGRCYDWRSVERRLNLAVLADVPGKTGSPACLYPPLSPGAEAFNQVRNTLFSRLGRGPATLVITGPTVGFGADVVAANLALALARSGHRTTLVVADESSQIPDLFGMPVIEGLTEVLRGLLETRQAIQTVPDVPDLGLIAAGHGLTSEIVDLEGSGIELVLDDVASASHFVLIRARASDVAADAQFFGRRARAALPVIEIGHTKRGAAAAALRQWQLVGTAVPGGVTVPSFQAPEPAPAWADTPGAAAGQVGPRARGSVTGPPASLERTEPSLGEVQTTR